MGAGQFPAGMGPAGFDPVFVTTSQSPAPYATAILYDPASQSFPLDANGNTIPVDPVDQRVAMLVGIEYGAVGSAPTVFTKMRKLLTRVPQAQKPALARQDLNRVLKDMIDAGDITILSVNVNNVARGTDQVFFRYMNERTGQPSPPMQVA